MGKLNHRLVAIVLLGVWCSFLSSANFNYQYRGVEFHSPDPGEIVFFIIYVVLGEIGKKLDKGYRCPSYCEAKHKHIYRENQVIPEDSTKYFEKNLALHR
jgi:hypothetical protein